MIIEPIIFYVSLATTSILAIVLIVLVFYFGKFIKKAHSNDIEKIYEARKIAVKVIDEANSKAIDIINKANLSENIASENFSQEIKRIASMQIKEFEKSTSDFMKLYIQVLHDLKSKNIEVFQNVSKDIEVNTMDEIKSFKKSMGDLTFESENLVKKKIDSDYSALKKEMQIYKEEKLQKIDQDIYEILERISKLVLGKVISLSMHEDLIRKSLEIAKKEAIFK